MYKQNDSSNNAGSWAVQSADGTVIRRFHGQTQAIDFAQSLQRKQKAILLIDVHKKVIQLINGREDAIEMAG